MYLLFTGSLAYYSFRLYSGSGLLSVPFEYFILGLGLISFEKIIRTIKIKELKNDLESHEFVHCDN
jgi:hypothetical protein